MKVRAKLETARFTDRDGQPFLTTGALPLNRGEAFLFLIARLMVFFWIALRFGAHVVHRHTQDPFAAALFAALVQGWAFAAWFVIRQRSP